MKNYPYLFAIFILLSFQIILFSQASIQEPYILEDICPFECCTFGKWVNHSPLKVFSSIYDTSSYSFSIAPGDTFNAINGNIEMLKLGIVVVKNKVQNFMPGDSIFTLTYLGEGIYYIWYNGSIDESRSFWHSPKEINSNFNINDLQWSKYSAVMVQKPIMIWWVHISTSDGRSGWLRLINREQRGFGINEIIEGKDGCS